MLKTKKAKKSQKGGGLYEFTGNFEKDLDTIQNFNNNIRNGLINYNDQNKTFNVANHENIFNVVVGNTTTIPGPISLNQAYNAFVEDANNTFKQVNDYFKPDQWQYLFIHGNVMKLFQDVMQTFNMLVNAGDNFHIQNNHVFQMQDGNYNFNNLISVQDQIEKNYNYVKEKLTIFMTYEQNTKEEQKIVLQAIKSKEKAMTTQRSEEVQEYSNINTYLKDTVYPYTDTWFNTNISKIYAICIALLNYYLANHNLELSQKIIDYVDNIITYQLERTFLRLKSLQYSTQELINNPTLRNTSAIATQANIRGNYEVFKDFRKSWLKVKKQKLETIEKIKKLYKKATPMQQQQQQPLSYTEYQALSKSTTPQIQRQPSYSRSTTPQIQKQPQQPYSRSITPQIQQQPQQPYSRSITPQIQQQKQQKQQKQQPQQQEEQQTKYEKTADSELYESLGLIDEDINYINNLKKEFGETVKDALLTFSIDGNDKELEILKSENPKKNKLHNLINRAIESKSKE